MARIRSIHPGIFSDEAFMRLTINAPLAIAVLLGLWTEADDNGVFEWKPIQLKARILPAVNCDIDELMGHLAGTNHITSYELAGRKYGAVRNFTRFQRPKKPNSIHPMTPLVRNYVGLKSGEFGTGGEISPQMEDGGEGEGEGEGDQERIINPNHSTTTSQISRTVANPTAGAIGAPAVDMLGEISRRKSKAKRRGRIPHDWQASIELIEFGASLGMTAEEVRKHEGEFIDFWRGDGGCKADWDATFRNRLRQILEWKAKSGRTYQPAPELDKEAIINAAIEGMR